MSANRSCTFPLQPLIVGRKPAQNTPLIRPILIVGVRHVQLAHCIAVVEAPGDRVCDPQRFVYDSAVRSSPTLFVVIPVIALLSKQLSGLHMHVNSDGADGLHGTHVHATDPDGHEHEHDIDVSLFELGASWGKLVLFLPPPSFIVPTFLQSNRAVRMLVGDTFQHRQRTRWRPPLRAPPLPLC